MEEKPRKEILMFKLLTFNWSQKQKQPFAEVSDPEIKKLVENSVQGNTRKSTKNARLI